MVDIPWILAANPAAGNVASLLCCPDDRSEVSIAELTALMRVPAELELPAERVCAINTPHWTGPGDIGCGLLGSSRTSTATMLADCARQTGEPSASHLSSSRITRVPTGFMRRAEPSPSRVSDHRPRDSSIGTATPIRPLNLTRLGCPIISPVPRSVSSSHPQATCRIASRNDNCSLVDPGRCHNISVCRLRSPALSGSS